LSAPRQSWLEQLGKQSKTLTFRVLARASLTLSKLKADNNDQRFGIEIVRKAVQTPLRHLTWARIAEEWRWTADLLSVDL
jgi:hypothetical protein